MKRTILAPGHELLSYRIHEVTPYINWIYFFHAWGFQPRFAAIANIHGCDSCRALWLTTFPEEERTKASEAMQLFKEAIECSADWTKQSPSIASSGFARQMQTEITS